jgi:hypothetical protein
METEKLQDVERALSAASEQIALALKDSQPAVDSLGESLGRLADLLASDLSDASARAKLAAVRREMGLAITGLQFYDRMTQHLGHVRDYLAGSAEQLGTNAVVKAEVWEQLNRKLSDRLLSDTHRIYLGKNFPADFLAGRGELSRQERGASSPGDVDLF